MSYFGAFRETGQRVQRKPTPGRAQGHYGAEPPVERAARGVGRLGRAIIGYPGFAPEGFKIAAAFDANRRMVGRVVGDLNVRSMDDLNEVVGELDIRIGIVAVPGRYAQRVIDRLVECGVLAIMNYAPITPQTRDGVKD